MVRSERGITMSAAVPGTPNWVDLGSPNLEASRAFYSDLFGWTAEVSPDPQFGGYTTFSKDGKAVAGAGALSNNNQIPSWSTYVSTDDADLTAAKVRDNGGTVVVAPMDLGQEGRMAVFIDPDGAPFSVWQGRDMPGAQLLSAPGALAWNELTTHDPNRAKSFYGRVFGWGAQDNADGAVTYTMFTMNNQPVGGMMPMSGEAASAELPALWMVYFAVEDCDATARRADELGGAVAVPAADNTQGRFAVLNDPQGAVFCVITPAGQTKA